MRYDDLLARLGAALEEGDVRPADVERLLEPRRSARPDAAGVLAATGLAVAFAGLALVVAVQWHTLERDARLVLPFLFPALALGAAVTLARAGRPAWQAEAAGLIGQGALIAALAILQETLNVADTSAYGALCGLIGVGEVLLCHRLIGSARMTGWGLSIAILAFINFGADAAAGGDSGMFSLGELLLVQAGVAAAVTAYLLHRRSEYAVHAARTSALLAYGAAVVGQNANEWDDFSGWHIVLSVAVVLTFLAAAVLRMDALIWVGAAGGLLWLVMMADVVGEGSDASGATLVVLAGLGLTALGLAVAQVRRIARPHGL